VPLIPTIPAGSDVFIDANIFVYGLNYRSNQCLQLLQRCSREEVIGISLFEIVNEATHVFMLEEAHRKGLIGKPHASELKRDPSVIPSLIDYWLDTERILALNLLLFPTDEQIVRNAQSQRQSASVLTNDSMILSWMRAFGITHLATADRDFNGATGITVFGPDDVV